MLKVLMIVLAASATNAAPCSVDDYGESLTAVTTCTSKLATDYAKVVLNFTANCESTSTIFTAWTSCVMANSKCVNGAFRSAVSTAVSLYSTILPTCDLVDRPYYTADFVLNPIPADFKEFAAADVNGTFPSQIYQLCVNGVQALGYSNALGAEWCGANADMIIVVVDAAFDQIKVILTPPAMGVNFVPPFSEIATITVEYTALDGRRSSFGPDISAAYRADATFTEVEVITSASTEPPAPSSQTDGLSGGAVAGIVIAGVFVLAVVFLVGRTGRSKGTAYEKKPILG